MAAPSIRSVAGPEPGDGSPLLDDVHRADVLAGGDAQGREVLTHGVGPRGGVAEGAVELGNVFVVAAQARYREAADGRDQQLTAGGEGRRVHVLGAVATQADVGAVEDPGEGARSRRTEGAGEAEEVFVRPRGAGAAEAAGGGDHQIAVVEGDRVDVLTVAGQADVGAVNVDAEGPRGVGATGAGEAHDVGVVDRQTADGAGGGEGEQQIATWEDAQGADLEATEADVGAVELERPGAADFVVGDDVLIGHGADARHRGVAAERHPDAWAAATLADVGGLVTGLTATARGSARVAAVGAFVTGLDAVAEGVVVTDDGGASVATVGAFVTGLEAVAVGAVITDDRRAAVATVGALVAGLDAVAVGAVVADDGGARFTERRGRRR